MNAIEFENVRFGYGDEDDGRRTVLDGASFTVGAGEFVALVGDNGSGKSTAAKMCDAFLAPDAGTVRVLGHDVGAVIGTSDVFALRREVAFVFQNPDDQLVASLVVDEVAFGPRNLGLPRDEIVARVEEALLDTGMADAVGRDVNTLSGGQRQRVAIADALAMRPKLLVLDEPTSMLDAQGRRDVMAVIERVREAGMTVLLVTHDPTEAARADRVLRMESGSVREIDASELTEALSYNAIPRISPASSRTERSGVEESRCKNARQRNPKACVVAARSLDSGRESRPPLGMTLNNNDKRRRRAPVCGVPQAAPIIRFENVSFRYDEASVPGIDLLVSQRTDETVLDGVDLDVREGELLAIAGPNGSGKTTLIQHMNGLLRPTSGRVVVDGVDTATKNGANAARRVVGITFQYPERSLFADTVRDEIAFGPRNLGLTEREADERVREAMERLALPFDRFSERSPFDLSGGEQRKVAIAGVLAMRPRVLVLDEPCAGMDAPSHAHLICVLQQLKSAGQTIVLVTHEEQDITILADRVFNLK